MGLIDFGAKPRAAYWPGFQGGGEGYGVGEITVGGPFGDGFGLRAPYVPPGWKELGEVPYVPPAPPDPEDLPPVRLDPEAPSRDASPLPGGGGAAAAQHELCP